MANEEYGKLRKLFFDAFDEGSPLYKLEDEIEKLARSSDENVADLARTAKELLSEISDLLSEDSDLDQALQDLQDALEEG